MAESSFPVLEQPLSDRQWAQIAQGFGSGIMAQGSEPYGIPSGGFNNATNEVTVGGRSPVTGDGRAIVNGFFHRYDTNVRLAVPAVTVATTYFLGLTYDPTQHAESAGPVRLTVTTTRPSGGGRAYLPIYRIIRQPNQLLSDAVIVDERTFIAPSITVKGEASLPPGDSLLSYTVATDFETGDQWQLSLAGRWERIGVISDRSPWSMGGWEYRGSNIMLARRRDGSLQASVEAELYRTGPTFTQGAAYLSHGWFVPPELRNDRGSIFIPAMIKDVAGFVALNTTTGVLMARTNSGTVTMNSGARISFQASWTVV